jgi:hypothetical protein
LVGEVPERLLHPDLGDLQALDVRGLLEQGADGGVGIAGGQGQPPSGLVDAHGATTLAFVVLWLAGGIFTPPSQMPDALATISRTLPSWGVVEVGQSVAGGFSLSASAVVVLTAWTVGAGSLAALAWRRVVTQ